MPWRSLLAREFAPFLAVLSHPDRIRIVEELLSGERDVNTLQIVLGVSQSRVSQHLGIMRAWKIVTERREGRHVHYRLKMLELGRWLEEGFQFLATDENTQSEIAQALQKHREVRGRSKNDYSAS
jgi:DNA-binding transcriptional ArsR family regulator